MLRAGPSFTTFRLGSCSIEAIGDESYVLSKSRTLDVNGNLTFDLTLKPSGPATSAVIQSWAPADGIGEDGRTVEFTIRLMHILPPSDLQYDAWGPNAVTLLTCVPDTGNDLPDFRPDCVAGEDDFEFFVRVRRRARALRDEGAGSGR